MAPGGSTVLVTGGAGFIGSHLVEALLEQGRSVRVLDNLSSGRLANLAFVRGLPAGRFELIQADLENDAARRRAVHGVETVFHHAALPSVQRSVEEPLASHQVNATGTLSLLQDARQAGVRRVVYASSSSVYGDSAELPKREDMVPDPCSPYAAAKLNGEHYCRIFHRLYGMDCVALRYFNVYGPRQDPASDYAAVIPRFVAAVRRNETPVIYGDGYQSRDFSFISDVVQANLKAATADDAPGEVLNVAGGRQSSLLDLLGILEGIAGRRVEARFEAPRAGDVRHSLAGIDRARKVLGWEPRVGLEDGLRRTMDSVPLEESHAT
jgi:UDP-glucose 4-epimerase